MDNEDSDSKSKKFGDPSQSIDSMWNQSTGGKQSKTGVGSWQCLVQVDLI